MHLTLSTSLVTASASKREVRGTICTFGVRANASTGPVEFEAGSLTVAEDLRRVKLLVQHDDERPVGYMTEADITDERADAAFHLPPGASGDVALTEAASGLRDGFSVGVDVTEHAWSEDGVLIVKAGRIREVSLVSIPAIDDARVSDVAATAQKGTPAMPCNTCSQIHAPGATCTLAPAPVAVAAAASAVVEANNAPPAISTSPRALDLAAAMRVAASTIAAGEGYRLEAALGDIVPADDAADSVAGGGRPQWVDQLWRASSARRPVIDALGTPRPLTGLKVQGHQRVYDDLIDEYEGNKAAIHGAGTFTTTPAEADAQRWAGGSDIDRAFVDLGSSDFLQDWFTAAVDEYRTKSEAYAVEQLLAGATTVAPAPTSVTNALAALGSRAAQLGSDITFVSFATDVWAEFVDLPASEVPWWLQRQGTINLGTVDGEAGGLRFSANNALPAGTVLAGDKRAATWYEVAPPVRVQAVNVANGGIDVGVFGYGALLINDARALLKAVITPAEAE